MEVARLMKINMDRSATTCVGKVRFADVTTPVKASLHKFQSKYYRNSRSGKKQDLEASLNRLVPAASSHFMMSSVACLRGLIRSNFVSQAQCFNINQSFSINIAREIQLLSFCV